MPNMPPRRLTILLLATVAAVAVIADATVYLLQPSAFQATAAVARKRCREHGWPERLLPRMYNDSGSGLTEGFVQEYWIEGTNPKMSIWVEVRRPLYAPIWRVAQLIETKVDLDPD